jgi:hypothetical protein
MSISLGGRKRCSGGEQYGVFGQRAGAFRAAVHFPHMYLNDFVVQNAAV